MFVCVACASKRERSASGFPINCTIKITGFRINSALKSERKTGSNVLFQQSHQFAMSMVDTHYFTAMIMKVKLTCENLRTVEAMLVARDCKMSTVKSDSQTKNCGLYRNHRVVHDAQSKKPPWQ